MSSTLATAARLPVVYSPEGETASCEVARGPNWLFIKLHELDVNAPPKSAELWADELWRIAERHFVYRMVVELEEVPAMPNQLTDALEDLHEKLQSHDGALRLCGMTPECEQQLHRTHHPAHTHERLHNHASRLSAVKAE